jgi:phospholipase C
MAAIIDHVVVLMLENRSFDCMLGRLYPAGPQFDGLTLNESNTYGMTYSVWNDPNMTDAIACVPDPDPGEAFVDMNMQLFGQADRPAGVAPAMSGFARNYGTQAASEGWRDPGAVMHYFTPEQVPVLSTLAKAFGVCDRWHASAPCQTWPNRFFAHTGTALGYVNNNTFHVPFEAPSLMRRLQDKGKSWRVYFHDMPQSILLQDVWLYALSNYRFFSQFLADAHAGSLPQYSFIEPRYFTDLSRNLLPNDQHPPHNILYGEQLIAQVYNALRSSPCWSRTLFVIVYDEHGGCYDHVPPPAATPPDHAMANRYGFTFNAYGVRVPAVVISPYVPPGSIIRPASATPFDHTSLIRTVRELFDLGPPLTARDGVAPSLVPVLSLPGPTNNGPPTVTAKVAAPVPSQVAVRANAAPNGMQAALSAAATILPTVPPAASGKVPDPAQLPVNPHLTVTTAQNNATVRTNQFLGVAAATAEAS